MISWWLPHLTKGPTPDFNNGLGNDFNGDVSKQIRLCTWSGAPARNSQVTCTKHSCGVISLTSLGQPTVRPRVMMEHIKGRKFTDKNEEKEK